MFDWLEREISMVKTPRFHLIEGVGATSPNGTQLIGFPSSYRAFVSRFGDTKLYRASRLGYQIGIFAEPKEETIKDIDRIVTIGFNDGSKVFYRRQGEAVGPAVFERELRSSTKVADDFEEWLRNSCDDARKSYGVEKWQETLNGPRPFTAEELSIARGRQQLKWRVLGVDASGRHMMEIANSGDRSLPVLTVGARSKNGRLNGAVMLKVGHIGPGQRDVLHVDCYKDLVAPTDMEIFDLPEPMPEDREYYDEFII